MPPKRARKRKNEWLVSTFDLMLNSNRSPPEYKDKVIKSMNVILNNISTFLKYVPMSGSSHPDWRSKIMGFKVHTFNYERATGTEAHNNGHHVHVLISFQHKTRIHIDRTLVKQFLKETWGYMPYFVSRFKSDPRSVLELYHKKGGGENLFQPTEHKGALKQL